MTKAELVERIAEGTGLSKVETQAVIDGFIAMVKFSLDQEERVELRGFGTFKSVERQERMARNPMTGEQVNVPKHRTAVFRASKEFKKYLNTKSDE